MGLYYCELFLCLYIHESFKLDPKHLPFLGEIMVGLHLILPFGVILPTLSILFSLLFYINHLKYWLGLYNCFMINTIGDLPHLLHLLLTK